MISDKYKKYVYKVALLNMLMHYNTTKPGTGIKNTTKKDVVGEMEKIIKEAQKQSDKYDENLDI